MTTSISDYFITDAKYHLLASTIIKPYLVENRKSYIRFEIHRKQNLYFKTKTTNSINKLQGNLQMLYHIVVY